MKDCKHIEDKKVRELSLNVDDLMSIDEHHEMLEEAHYTHTINTFVELIVVYGHDKVIGDLRIAMSKKEW